MLAVMESLKFLFVFGLGDIDFGIGEIISAHKAVKKFQKNIKRKNHHGIGPIEHNDLEQQMPSVFSH